MALPLPQIKIASPENLQFQSGLINLPLEIKYIIYGYCFTAEEPIVDPVSSQISEDTAVPKLSIALLQTCRRVFHEVDLRPLFSQNTFRFTRVDYIRHFFKSIRPEHGALIQDIEVDARRLTPDHPGISREWLHYLTWGGGPWAKLLGSLRLDAPGLKCLRLNFEAWPSIPMFRTELWNLLRSMLLHVEGLDRMVVIGASKGGGMAQKEPWSPVHFVGGDDVGSDDLVERLWRVVGEEDDKNKVIRWSRSNGRLYLEVVTFDYLLRKVDRMWKGFSQRARYTDPWPENGSCSWFSYQNRNSGVS